LLLKDAEVEHISSVQCPMAAVAGEVHRLGAGELGIIVQKNRVPIRLEARWIEIVVIAGHVRDPNRVEQSLSEIESRPFQVGADVKLPIAD